MAVAQQERALSRRDVVARYRTRSSMIGAVTVTMTRLPAGVTVVRPAHAAEARMMHLLLPVETSLIVREREGEQFVVGSRELTWLPSWTLTALYASRSSEIAWIEVPERVLDKYPGIAGTLPARPAASSTLLEPARAFVQTAVAGRHGVEPLAARLFEDLLGAMIESLVVEARGAHPRSEKPPLRQQAMAHITAFRDDADLNPQQIARCLRISVRQLQRAFEEAGTTVAGEIRRQRLEAAVTLLSNGDFDSLTVSEVAARAGFRNDAELRRALSADTGRTPSELRARRC